MYELLDLIEDEAFVIDESFELFFVNRAARERLGGSKGRCFEAIHGRVSPCGSPLWECPLRTAKREGSASLVHPAGVTTGHEGYLKVSLHRLEDGKFLETRRDVSAERELERQILIHHNHLEAISRISFAVSGLSDLKKVLDAALDVLLTIFPGCIGGILLYDRKKEELVYEVQRGLSLHFNGLLSVRKGRGVSGRVAERGEPLLLLNVDPNDATLAEEQLAREGVRSIVSVPLKAKEVVGVLNVISSRPYEFDREDLYLLSSIGYQLGMATEQARLYERLKNARERYKRLLDITFAIQEEERKRIARELHDETSQNLTALTLNLTALKEMVEREGLTESVRAIIGRSHEIAVAASVELTRIIRELRPTLLDTLGLPAAIRHLVETNLKAKNINVSVDFEGLEGRLPQDIELALFRITQEAISNILRHSNAKNVKVSLASGQNEWILRIEDDGIGFNIQEIKTIEEGGRGAGLFGMKERLRLVGGYGWIDSAPGSGTKINAFIPKRKGKGREEDKDNDSR